VASILRTNYNLKLYKSEDVSYNLGIMGLWTYAEIAIGIIVSCLPVLPKFFQHFGPKFQWFLLPKDKIDTKSRSISLFRSPTAKARSSSKNSTPLANHTQGMGTSDMWKDSGTPKPRATDEDLTLDDYETPPPVLPKSLVTGGISGSQKEGNATVRNDLEAGYRNMF